MCFGTQQFQVGNGVGIPSASVLAFSVCEMHIAAIRQASCIPNDLGHIGIGGTDLFFAEEAVRRRCDMFWRSSAQQRIRIHRTFQTVNVEIAFRQLWITTENCRGQCEQALLVAYEGRETQAVHIARTHTDILVGSRFFRNVGRTERVDDECIGHLRRAVG